MSERNLNLMDIREILNHIRAGSSDRQVQRDTGLDRRTVKRYRQWAEEQGLLAGPLPALEELQSLVAQTLPEKTPPQNTSSVASYRGQIQEWLNEQVEIAAMYQRLQEQGYTGSYVAVWRLARKLEPRKPEVVTRVERQPGEEGQVDFGYAGRMLDPETGQLRRAWAFVMTLSWSRHQYVEFVFDQKIATWLTCHRHAFEFFSGVPRRLVIDNLKAAITKSLWDDPQVQYSYRECAEHYGFLIAPCRVATPEHKGKVEQGGVHYVVRNFLGGREPALITHNNRQVRTWCQVTAGLRIHGTTKERPLERFQRVESHRLKPLPVTPYDLSVWKKAKVYRDGYVTFDNAFYSVPSRLYPGQVWICGGCRQVRIFNLKYKLETTHERARHPGERLTNPAHLPPEKLPGWQLDPDHCLAQAQEIGPTTLKIVQDLLADPVLDRLPTAGRLVRLRQRFGDERLEAACCRALAFDDPSYRTVKRILSQGLEQEDTALPLILPPATTFARPPAELVGELMEVAQWN